MHYPQDLSLDIAAGPNVAGITLDIAAGGSDITDAVALNAGSIVPPAIGVRAKMVTGAGTPDGNKRAVIYALWSLDGTNFDDTTNRQIVLIIEIAAASTTFEKHRVIPVQGKSVKFEIENDQVAGPALTTGTDLEVFDVHGDQV